MEKTSKLQTPHLLRISLNQERNNAQPSTLKSPKLLKVVLPGYRDKIGKPKELFRLPLSELPLNYSNHNKINVSREGITDKNSLETSRKAPKLINLKKIFQKAETMHLPHYPIDKNIQKEIKEVPQLIRLPDLNQKTNKDDKFKRPNESKSTQVRGSQLAQIVNNLPEVPLTAAPLQMLESPKHSTQLVKDTKQPTIPKIIDIRPNTPQQETRLAQLTEARENNPPKLFAKNTQRTTITSPAAQESKSRSRRRRRNKTDSISSEEDVYYKNKHDKKNKVDDEIYDILYELILEKKKRKKRQQKRKLKLFDIIDNLPITSESEESPLVNKTKQKSKVNLSNIPNVGLSFRPSNFISKENENQNKQPYQSAVDEPIERRPDFLKQVADSTEDMLYFDSGIPDAPKLNTNENFSKQAIEKENSSLDQYKPVMSKFLHPDKVNDDPLSWKNILKLTRNDSKHTQTETYETKTHAAEVQTEIQEMVEIPKTQTFFTEPDIKQTNEFCERVRREIIEKLDINKKVLENKCCQTVSDAKTQTKPSNSPERIDSEEHFLQEQQNIQMKRNEEEVEQIIGIEPKLDPNLMNQLYFNVDENPSKQFLNVIDIEADDKLSINNEDQDTKKHAVNENKSEVAVPEDVIRSFENTNPVTREDEDDFTEVVHENNIGNSDKDEQDKRQPKVTRGYETSSPRANKSFGVSYKRTDTSKQPKELLEDNIKNFSFGLKALEEMQENIERELKHSKFLFNTIETLQRGFDEDDNPIQTADNIKVNSTKYPIYKNDRDGASLNYQNKLYRENLISSKNLLSDRKSVDEGKDVMSITKGEMEDDLLSKGSVHSNKDNHANDNPDNILADSLYVVHNFDDDNYVATEQLSCDGEKGKADGLSFTSISNDNRDLDPNAESSFFIHTDNYGDINQIEDKEKKKKEELFKESIRRKLRPPPEEDPATKKKKEKRAKLLDWMKRKQKERSKEYLQQLEVKREQEFQPFVSRNNVSTFEIGQDKVLKAETKRIILEENNEERIHLAEKLANEIISSARKKNITQKENLSRSKRHGYNTRYQSSKSTSAIPVRETRSSKIRKTALLKEIIKNTSNAEYTDRKRRKKLENKKTKKTQKSSKKLLSTYRVNSNNMLNTDTANINKTSVDPGNFVTLGSYLNYQPKSNDILLNESMQQYTLRKSMDTLASANIQQSLSGRVSGHDRSNMALYSPLKTNDSIDTSKVGAILRNYGYNVDEEMFGRKSETSRLLAEVDMFLIDDEEAAFSQTSPTAPDESIDWNEIENILNE